MRTFTSFFKLWLVHTFVSAAFVSWRTTYFASAACMVRITFAFRRRRWWWCCWTTFVGSAAFLPRFTSRVARRWTTFVGSAACFSRFTTRGASRWTTFVGSAACFPRFTSRGASRWTTFVGSAACFPSFTSGVARRWFYITFFKFIYILNMKIRRKIR